MVADEWRSVFLAMLIRRIVVSSTPAWMMYIVHNFHMISSILAEMDGVKIIKNAVVGSQHRLNLEMLSGMILTWLLKQ